MTGVDHSMELMREETFGPVVPVMKFKTLDEALELANDSTMALTSSIWTKNVPLGKQIAFCSDRDGDPRAGGEDQGGQVGFRL